MKYVLSLGSNKGDRYKFIRSGIEFLSGFGTIISESSIYETSPVGMGDHASQFLNSILVLEADIKPDDMLRSIKQFEEKMGRDLRNSHLQPRRIDIDILFADNLIIKNETLCIPHPEIGNRKFVLKPLNEILPEFRHPVSGKTIRDLLTELNSDENVRLFRPGEEKDI